MITEIATIEELKQEFLQILLNHTTKVTKVSEIGVLNAVSFGIAKQAQKIIKDIAIIESHLFPDTAFDEYLDKVGTYYGVGERFTNLESSGYVRLVGDVGTVYTKITHTFRNKNGVEFKLENDTETIGEFGYIYAKLKSVQKGSFTNIEPYTINSVNPVPSGHKYISNEYYFTGGRDLEDDDDFRNRMLNRINLLSRGTLPYLLQVFLKFNSNILRIFYLGRNSNGRLKIGVITQNGADLTNAEISNLKTQVTPYLNLGELIPEDIENTYDVLDIVNIEYQAVDVSIRCEIKEGYNVEDVRKELQLEMQKVFDYRFLTLNSVVEWDDLFVIAKQNAGIKYIYDNYFLPRVDFKITKGKLPRLRGFLLLDAEGNIISQSTGNLLPTYYPNEPDLFFSTIM